MPIKPERKGIDGAVLFIWVSSLTEQPLCRPPCLAVMPWKPISMVCATLFLGCLCKHTQLISPVCSALRQVELHLPLRVPWAGRYVVVVEYSTEAEQMSVADVHVGSPGPGLAGQVTIYSCQHRYQACPGGSSSEAIRRSAEGLWFSSG